MRILSWHVIPLDTTPDQKFGVTVDVDGTNIPLILHLRYNTEGEFWHLDVTDGKTQKMLISNLPLVTGGYPAADLLRQQQYYGIGSALIVKNTDITSADIPGLFDLGTDFVLLWGVADE